MYEVTAELSSLQTALEEIAKRIKSMTDLVAADPNDLTSVHLISVERALTSAIRSISKAQRVR